MGVSLALAVLLTFGLFRRQAVLFWAVIAPLLAAFKLGVPAPLLMAGFNGVVVGMIFHILWGGSPDGDAGETSPADAKLRHDLQALPEVQLRMPLMLVVAFTALLNAALAWLVLGFVDPAPWLATLGLNRRWISFAYLLATLPSAIGFFLLFVRAAPAPRP